jgi:ABC-type Co2+ transport system permease subunit
MPVHVPAGKYLINLSVVFSSGSEASAGLYCSVKAVGQTNTTFGTGLDGFVGGAVGYTSASEQDAVVMTTPGAISAYCGTNSGNTTGTAGIYTADLTALAVSAVHRTGS